MTKQHEHILFFDGVCSLCNNFVNFLMRIDKKKKLRFASLQGKTAEHILPKEMTTNLNSLVLIHEGQFLSFSTASLTALRIVGGWYTIFYIFILLPKFIRDGVYRIIAKNRYSWFGKRASCRVATKEEVGRILD